MKLLVSNYLLIFNWNQWVNAIFGITNKRRFESLLIKIFVVELKGLRIDPGSVREFI